MLSARDQLGEKEPQAYRFSLVRTISQERGKPYGALYQPGVPHAGGICHCLAKPILPQQSGMCMYEMSSSSITEWLQFLAGMLGMENFYVSNERGADGAF